MLGSQVFRDFQLDQVCEALPTQTQWGKDAFRRGLTSPSDDPTTIKQKQLPLLALACEPKACDAVRKELETLTSISTSFQSCISNSDSMTQESFKQVFWAKDSFGASLNTHSSVLNGLVFWKSIILPGFAILTPLLGLILPFFVLKFIRADMSVSEYLEHVKVALMKQISIPSFLKAKGDGDKFGYVLESLFIGLTLVMFISGLWNQVNAALHLRSIWSEIERRGTEFQTLVRSAQAMLSVFHDLPLKKQRALRVVLKEGDAALLKTRTLLSMKPAAAFGALWNDEMYLNDLVAWIGKVDVMTAIVNAPTTASTICFPTLTNSNNRTPILDIKGVYHPMLPKCVKNDYCSSGHVILTGPNRGGKSTYCRAIGLAVLTAQSWGFAWATSMKFTPFGAFWSALEPNAQLGEMSTFEAEIEFAKQVLALPSSTPCFVMMDEIFHSTNAMDGLAASKVFLEQLYDKQGCMSLISTHYKDLATHFSGRATPLQMIADGDIQLLYTYKVGAGISEKSSVMEILKERGLLSAAAAANYGKKD